MTATTHAHRSAMHAAYGQYLGNVVFPIGSVRQWQIGSLDKLASLHNLRPNWDSYGSPPISDDVLGIAKKLVGEAGAEAPLPQVTAVSGGGVQLTWEHGAKILVVLIRSDHSVEGLVDNGADTAYETTLPSRNSSPLTKILEWLTE